MASQPTAWTKTTLWYISDERSVNGVELEVDELILSVGLEDAVDHIRGGDRLRKSRRRRGRCLRRRRRRGRRGLEWRRYQGAAAAAAAAWARARGRALWEAERLGLSIRSRYSIPELTRTSLVWEVGFI